MDLIRCRTGQPNDIATATDLVIQIYGGGQSRRLRRHKPAPTPTQ
jgi:hypothetical protein